MKPSSQVSLILFLSILLTISAYKTNLKTSIDKSTENGTNILQRKLETKSDGSGTWLNGYECPGILINKSKSDIETRYPLGYFYPSHLNSTDAPYSLGFPFNFTTMPTNEIILDVFTHFQDTIYYIPYSLLASNFTYSNPSYFDYQQIRGSVKKYINGTTNFTTINFKILLPYGTFSRYISHQEAEDIVNTLNINLEKYHHKVEDAKNKIKENVNNYFEKEDELELKHENETKKLILNQTLLNDEISHKTNLIKGLEKKSQQMKKDLVSYYKTRDEIMNKVHESQKSFKKMSNFYKKELKNMENMLNDNESQEGYFTFSSLTDFQNSNNDLKAKYSNLSKINNEIKFLINEQYKIERIINETNYNISSNEKEIIKAKTDIDASKGKILHFNETLNDFYNNFEIMKNQTKNETINEIKKSIQIYNELTNHILKNKLEKCLEFLQKNNSSEYFNKFFKSS